MYHISGPIIGRFSPNLVLVRARRGSFIDSFNSAKKRCNASQGFGPFSVSHVSEIECCSLLSESFSLFFLFLDFTAISDCVSNNKNKYSTQACWISNNYNHFGAVRLVGYLSYPAPLRCNLRVPTRVYDV